MFPVLSQVRDRARQAGCLSNLRQVATAWSMYAQDHDDTFPPALYWGSERGERCFYTGLYRAVLPYMKDNDIFRCPTDPTAYDIVAGQPKTIAIQDCTAGGFPMRYISYTYSRAIFRSGTGNPLYDDYGWPIRPVLRLAEIEYPTETALLWDGRYAKSGGPCVHPAEWPGIYRLVEGRHQERTSVVWADLHVRSLKVRPTGESCPTADGKAAPYAVITDPGPYHGLDTLEGIPFRTADGSWSLRW